MIPIGEPVVVPDDTIVYEIGTVEKLEDETERPAAVLWIPDPEQRHGWREYYVKKAAPKPGMRKMGYYK